MEALGELAVERGVVAAHSQRDKSRLDTLGLDLHAHVEQVSALPDYVVELHDRRVPVALDADRSDGEGDLCDSVECLCGRERLAEAAHGQLRDRRLCEQL
eukprot:3932113-Rhodomonas_salina.1